MLINILILTISIVYIWNHSGFIFDITKMIFKKLNPEKPYLGQPLPKPFSCYSCMTFWVNLVYALFYLNIIYSLGIGVAASILAILIDKLLGLILKYINKIK